MSKTFECERAQVIREYISHDTASFVRLTLEHRQIDADPFGYDCTFSARIKLYEAFFVVTTGTLYHNGHGETCGGGSRKRSEFPVTEGAFAQAKQRFTLWMSSLLGEGTQS